MTPNEIREAFLSYFEEREHTRVASDSLVPENDPSLLFTGAGMNQFKQEFLGKGRRGLVRAVTSQKCMRTGDLDNVGRTCAHHSFFEMLGNFSFGDYFKREAIEWGWDLVVNCYGLPVERLSVSVYEEDDEAYAVWRDVIGLPEDKIHRFDAGENFWPPNAPTEGPDTLCGPCSEIFYDWGAEHSTVADGVESNPATDGGRYTEVGNLVFQQFERKDGKLTPLEQMNIDTGFGFERLVAVKEGVYRTLDTRLFRPIVDAVARLAGHEAYESESDGGVRCRRIADHVRGACFLVGDGVRPGNEGRGYVLRRLMRRAIRDGFGLGIEEPFLALLVPPVLEAMGDAYPDLVRGRELLESVMKAEEQLFRRTFRNGMKRLDAAVEEVLGSGGKELAADLVFQLHDTYGFPVDVTADVLGERGLEFDQERYDELMQEQRERARGARKMTADIFERGPVGRLAEAGVRPTEFLGYGADEANACGTRADARVVGIVVGDDSVGEITAGTDAVVVLDRTPFYAEAGGQTGDTGVLRFEGEIFRVSDCSASEGYYLHSGSLDGGDVKVGDACVAAVDGDRRDSIRRNHTATHLLHKALKDMLGDTCQQAGSLVAPDKLRFDFTLDRALTAEEIDALERAVNAEVLRNVPLETALMGVEEAKQSGAVALFGEKYPDPVRVVTVGEYSRELCGGTHCFATGDIGSFRITSESSIAAGIRRVEAVTGAGSVAAMQEDRAVVKAVAGRLGVATHELDARIEKLTKDLKAARKAAKSATTAPAFDALTGDPVEGGGVRVYVHFLERPREELQAAGEALIKAEGDPAAALMVTRTDGKLAALVAGNPAAVAAGFDAAAFIRAAGGRGGGRPPLAQGTFPGEPTLESLTEGARSALAGIGGK